MNEALNKLKEIVSSSKTPMEERMDPRDAVGQAAISRSEQWLANNQGLPKDALYGKWKTEFRAGAIVTPNNKDYMWETESKLHPKGPDFATNDYLTMIHERLDKMDDLGKKSYLQDIAREAPSPVLNNLLLDMRILDQKGRSKTQERARLANIHEFDKTSTSFIENMYSGKTTGLNPEVSVSSHGEDLTKAWGFNRDDIFIDDTGRIAITTEEGQIAPVWSLEERGLTWEEIAVNAQDISPIAKRKVKKALEYSRSNARATERAATLELGKTVENQPREFQSSITVDYAEISPDPMLTLQHSVHASVDNSIERGDYLSLKDLARDYWARWEDIRKTIDARASNGMASHTQGGSNV